MAELAQTRLAVLSDIVPMVDFLFLDEPAEDQAAWAKAMNDGAGDLLAAAIAVFESIPWQAETIKAAIEDIGAARGLKLGKAQAPIRVALTGRTVGLPLFESMAVLGRDRTLARLRSAVAQLAGQTDIDAHP